MPIPGRRSPITSSTPTSDTFISELRSLAESILGQSADSVTRLAGGRNNQVYKLACPDGSQFVAKLYYRDEIPGRHRLEREFNGLKFLWENGERAVPKPIAADLTTGWAFYEYVDGSPVPSSQVTESDIDDAVAFVSRLGRMKGIKGSDLLSTGAQACFSAKDILDNIEARRAKLWQLQFQSDLYDELRAFLREEFAPALDEMVEWCRVKLDKRGSSFSAEIEEEDRTLSPSDFGFHNTLRRGDGQITFLDFEYFGWDDPAKMISDFLLHPAMQLPSGLKQRFAEKTISSLDATNDLASRVEAVYPLFGMNWCMILLNEFLPESLRRRRFAISGQFDEDGIQAEQLAKARRMLNETNNQYKQLAVGG